MLVLTGLFLNNAGNQSMLNSLRGYENEYDLTLFTVANLNSHVFIEINKSKELLKKTEFIYWPSKIIGNLARINSYIKKIQPARKEKFLTSEPPPSNDDLSNTKISNAVLLNYKIRSIILAIYGIILYIRKRPDVVCAYEIHSMLATKVIKKIFPNSKIFGKFQGTVLCENLDSDDFHGLSISRHTLDADAMRYAPYLDASIMTNDGTRGDEVLQKFGCKKDSILLIPNGVDNRFINSRNKHGTTKIKSQKIRTLSVSRLMGWKRVDKIIHAYDILKGNDYLHHTIIGPGDKEQVSLIKDLIQKYNLTKNVTYLGGSPIEKVIESLNETDLLISVYKHGLITNPVFEALAMGTPVLTIKNKALIDVLGERAIGCFFIEEPGSDNLPLILSEFLKKLTKEDIKEKKEYLLTLSPPTWDLRSKIELDFISNIKKFTHKPLAA